MTKKTNYLLLAISEAAEIQQELDTLNAADSNLSIAGAVAEAVRQGGVDAEADRVVEAMESDSHDGKMIKAAFNRLCIATRNFQRTSILQPRLMHSYLGDSIEALSRLQIGRASMMLSVVRFLVANEPDLWGEMDSPTSHTAAIAKAKQRLEEAYRKIEAAITLADLMVHSDIPEHLREAGMSKITFRLTANTLCLGDGRNVAENLTNWWLRNDGKKRVAA